MIDYSQLYKDFISKPKSLLIAPAGCGKTYTIAECLKYTGGTQLVLTHTHAGVAAIKEKVKKSGIDSNKYYIETIDSFAQKYVNAFYCKNDIPPQENNNRYFPFIIKQATRIVKIKPIKDIIKITYSGLFVDEYQDCTKTQHLFVMALSNIIPVHLLGDHLQGIFYFREELMDWKTDLNEFANACFKLTEPWRWKNTNPQLGNRLKEIRNKLENEESIDLKLFESDIEILLIEEKDIYIPYKEYYKRICNLLDTESSLLLIHPNSQNFNARKKIIKNFKNRIYLLEAMDGKDFYNYSKDFDNSDSGTIYRIIYKIICNIFNKTELNKWFNRNSLKNKRNDKDKIIIAPIKANMDKLNQSISFILVSKILKQIKNIPNVICYRKELFYNLCKALEQAEYQNISVYEAMKNIRNVKRRIGRKIEGKCIGTTLLTKGLEFDTVAILNAHKFNCPKNLYVALTRASKKLIIFTTKVVLSPYNN